MLQTLRNAWKIPELRKKILYTILLLIVFRFGSVIPVPWIDKEAMSAWVNNPEGGLSLFNMLDTFSGGAFSQATIFAMSISPYINSSIIMQLLCVAIPALERMSKEGEEGRKKITAITRILTVVLAAVQAYGLYVTLHNMGAINAPAGMSGYLVAGTIIVAFTAGTAFLMWLGEQITGRGIGNGISMIIFAGIVSRVPTMIHTAWVSFGLKQWYVLLLLAIYTILSIVFVILVNQGERRIPVQYAKRVVGRKMYGGQNSNIPIKVAMAGVMPIIFAMSIVSFPATLAQIFAAGDQTSWLWSVSRFITDGWVYPVLYFLLIVGFTYFYTSISFNPIEVSNNIKTNNGMIPGIRPGRPTTEYIAKVLSRITLLGSFCLGLIAVIPIVVSLIFPNVNMMNLSLTGTSLLIVVGVALETVREVESQMLMRHYKGFLE